jgi:hypothetical protein
MLGENSPLSSRQTGSAYSADRVLPAHGRLTSAFHRRLIFSNAGKVGIAAIAKKGSIFVRCPIAKPTIFFISIAGELPQIEV